MLTLNIPLFILSALSVHRLTLFITKDIGPFRVFEKLRTLLKREAKLNKALKQSDLHEGIECPWCVSVWFSLILAGLLMWYPWMPEVVKAGYVYFLLMLSLSSLSIAWNFIFTKD